MLEIFQVSASNRKGGYKITFALIIILVNNKARRRYYGIN